LSQGRIESIGAEDGRQIPADAMVIDAKGRYAVPGLFDSHAHTATPIHFVPARDVSYMAANVAFGITSVRDMGSDITLVKAWNDRRAAYGAPVPRIFSAGAMTEARPFAHGGSLFAQTESQARHLVRKQKRDGVVGIKSYFTLPWPLQRATADEARRQNLPVFSHGMIFREVVMGAVLGRASIEHNIMPTRVYSDILKLMSEAGTVWCPTIGIAAGGNVIAFSEAPQLLQDPKLKRAASRSDLALAEGIEMFAMNPAAIAGAFANVLASVKEARQLGVTVLGGTDALNPNTFYGHSVHLELQHLARSGIEPIDVLRAATIDAARTVGAHNLLGTLEPGKLADVVILDKNPLVDIANTMQVWRVILGGHLFNGVLGE